MIDELKISELVNKMVSGYSPDKIILFGSYAKGNPNENSDLDFLLIKESDLPRPQRIMQVRKLIYGAMIPIDLIVYTQAEIEESMKSQFGFVSDILKTGRILYERKN